MPRFMLNREVLSPPGYSERQCLLVKYRLPLLPHCFIICCETRQEKSIELLGFIYSQAEALALSSVGNSQAFMLIHSGISIRKRATWHVHVFVVQKRWQKAWVYGVLAIKNISLAFYSGVCRLFPHKQRAQQGVAGEPPASRSVA